MSESLEEPTRWKLRDFQCTRDEAARNDILAHEVLPRLWIGNRKHASSKGWIETNNVHHILNVAHEVPCTFAHCGTVEYLHLLLKDERESDSVSLDQLEQGYAFIERGLQSGASVLVNCWAGRNRSATFVIYYMARTFNMSAPDAMYKLASLRPFICIHTTLLQQVVRKLSNDRGKPETDYDGDVLLQECSKHFAIQKQCGCTADSTVWKP